MAYTPSTLLALPLITTGTEDGTWGNVVDNGLTSYLDIAVGGSIAITIDAANVTMTNTAGTNTVTNIATTATSATTSANTAQYAILNISGLKTAARSLILLGANGRKQYFINNAGTGGYALTVKAAASTGVTLVDGEKAIVIWNGTDYVKMAPGITPAGATTDLTAISVPSAGTASALTLTGGTSTTAATAGGAVTILGGTGASTGAAGAGGAVNITGGTSGSNASGAVSGGAVNITGGVGNSLNSAGAPGSVVISGGLTAIAGQSGGAVTISGASGYPASSTATGGAITITAGPGGSITSGTGGAVSISAGASAGSTGGTAGTTTISAGTTTGTAGNAGQIVFNVPAASGSGTAGATVFKMGGTEHARLLATGAWSFGATGTAYGSTGQVLTSAGNGDPVWSTAIVSATVQNSTSGTSIDFTSIPSWVKRVTIMFNGISTSGTSSYQVQAGAGSVTVSGYNGGCATGATFTSNSTGLIFNSAAAAAEVTYGSMVLTNITGNTWIASGNVYANAARGYYLAGQIALGGALDRVRITTVGGTDTFDLGAINIFYE